MYKPFLLMLSLLLGNVAALHALEPVSKLYIVNTLSENISVIDMTTDEVVATIPIASQGYAIALAPDSNEAYVTASSGAVATQHATTPQILHVDLTRQHVAARFPLRLSPLARINVRPDGKMAYVVTAGIPGKRNDERGQVLFVNLDKGNVEKVVPIGLNPLDSIMTPDGHQLYTVDWASHAISQVNLTEARLQDTIPLGSATARTLTMRDDGRKLYTILEATPVQNAYNVTAQLGNNSYTNAVNTRPASTQQANTPDDRLLWEIDTTNGNIEKYPFTGLSPIYALALSPDNRLLYAYGREIASMPDNILRNNPPRQQVQVPGYNLYVFDLLQKAVTKRFGNYGYLSALVISADGKKLYLIGTPGDPAIEASVQSRFRAQAANLRSGVPGTDGNKGLQVDELMEDLRKVQKTVTVLDAQTGNILKRVFVGNLPQGVAVMSKVK